jgi:phosphatidylglycerophosphate synthase
MVFGSHFTAFCPISLYTRALTYSGMPGQKTAFAKPYILMRMENRPDTEANNVAAPALPRTWDARLARHLVAPLKDTRITPNYLTTLRLFVGLIGAVCLARGGYKWSNAGALLIVVSNFLDHTDGELARISGKSSKLGHYYDLASDALITVALFLCMGIGIASRGEAWPTAPVLLGGIAGVAVALIFFVRMRIEALAGKAGTQQASAYGFETEDVLYLLPLVTLAHGIAPFIVTASIGAPLFALWVVFDYRRVVRRLKPEASASEALVSR